MDGAALEDGIASAARGGALLTAVGAAGMNGLVDDVLHDVELKRRRTTDIGDGGDIDLKASFAAIGTMKAHAHIAIWSSPAPVESLCCGSARPLTLGRARANGRCHSTLDLGGMLWSTLRPIGTDSVAPERRALSARRDATKRPGANSRSASRLQTLRAGED